MDPQDRAQLSQDGFKWYPMCLPDNCVEYMLFVLDSQLEPRSLLAELEKVRGAAMQLCAAIAKDYIWQRDSFQLQIKREDGLVYLHGTTDYGDSIEDEWLIVYLLRRLTTACPSLWVRVFDSDGEFLLIEAANVVPKGLNPEIDSNRAWIHQGKLQLVPMSVGFGAKRPLSLAEAVQFITLQPVALVHSPFIEAEAFYRLEKYPESIKASLHHSLITIPRKLAYILHEQPAAIAPAIESFYLRDAVTLKPLSASPSNLHFPPKDLVTVSVRFTKVLFAQVKSQQFAAPPLWSTIVQSIEQGTAIASEQEQKVAARLELGMKVTSGFEMLAASANGKHNRLAREFADFLEHVEADCDKVFPSDEDIANWPTSNKEDNETWLDINFEDFENELQGNPRPKTGQKNGFGDAKTQADLRKIVSRFEDFLNDETAGFEGAELDDMDHDNDSDENGTGEGDDDNNESEDEDKAVSFDEEQFDKMMSEMMGFPEKKSDPSAAKPQENSPDKGAGCAEEFDEEAEIRELAAQMEAELKGHGALKLDAKSGRAKILDSEGNVNRKERGRDKTQAIEEESGDDEVDIDYNLAKNLLDSFKSQGGLAGPAGNMIGMMGMKLPRDESDGEEEEEMAVHGK